MRLWHKDLIPVLPKQQLLGQWRECCCIARNIAVNGTPNHLLVNKIMDYPIEHFRMYSGFIYFEMIWKGYKPNEESFSKWINLFDKDDSDKPAPYYSDLFKDWHNDRYMHQCLMNLQEKFDCGGIGICEYEKIMDFTQKWIRKDGAL